MFYPLRIILESVLLVSRTKMISQHGLHGKRRNTELMIVHIRMDNSRINAAWQPKAANLLLSAFNVVRQDLSSRVETIVESNQQMQSRQHYSNR